MYIDTSWCRLLIDLGEDGEHGGLEIWEGQIYRFYILYTACVLVCVLVTPINEKCPLINLTEWKRHWENRVEQHYNIFGHWAPHVSFRFIYLISSNTRTTQARYWTHLGTVVSNCIKSICILTSEDVYFCPVWLCFHLCLYYFIYWICPPCFTTGLFIYLFFLWWIDNFNRCLNLQYFSCRPS